VAGLARRVARALLGLASYWPLLMSAAAQETEKLTIQQLQENIATAVGAAGELAFKSMPWTSQRTKFR
jgi:hypothetical protein